MNEGSAPTLQDARHRVEAAHLLHREGFPRDAISRAYYAVFNAAAALLEQESDLNLTTHAGRLPHPTLIQRFGLHFVRDGPFVRDTARRIDKLRQRRDACDYSAYQPSSDEVVQWLRFASTFLQQAGELMAR
ncbi:MAG: HEPN domain-containing protein [Rhodothermales bacterium]